MSKPFENKSPEVIDTIEVAFPGTKARIKAMKCPCCSNQIKMEDFRDALSRKEYTISGMCQVCQDSIWGGPDSEV